MPCHATPCSALLALLGSPGKPPNGLPFPFPLLSSWTGTGLDMDRSGYPSQARYLLIEVPRPAAARGTRGADRLKSPVRCALETPSRRPAVRYLASRTSDLRAFPCHAVPMPANPPPLPCALHCIALPTTNYYFTSPFPPTNTSTTPRAPPIPPPISPPLHRYHAASVHHKAHHLFPGLVWPAGPSTHPPTLPPFLVRPPSSIRTPLLTSDDPQKSSRLCPSFLVHEHQHRRHPLLPWIPTRQSTFSSTGAPKPTPSRTTTTTSTCVCLPRLQTMALQ
jgi:hypothetical protein